MKSGKSKRYLSAPERADIRKEIDDIDWLCRLSEILIEKSMDTIKIINFINCLQKRAGVV